MKLVIVLFLSFFYFTSHSQVRYIFSFKDKFNNALSFTSIFWGKSSAVYANESGIAIVESSSKIDSFYISNVGFNAITKTDISENEMIDTIRVILEEKVFVLKEVVVLSGKNYSDIGVVNARQTSFIVNKTGYRQEAAILVEKCPVPSQILSISVFVSKASQKEMPFRIRIYSLTEEGLPGEDILTKNLIIKDYKSNDWNEINVEDLSIITTQSRFFISFEWMASDMKLVDGLQIGLTNKYELNNTYYKLGNKGWKRHGANENASFNNIMIKARIRF